MDLTSKYLEGIFLKFETKVRKLASVAGIKLFTMTNPISVKVQPHPEESLSRNGALLPFLLKFVLILVMK